MPLSRALKIVHIHVPKCGGTSVSAALTEAGASFTFVGPASERDREQYGEKWLHHIPAERLLALVGEEEWRKFFKFGFVRNPWDRAVSLYCAHVLKQETTSYPLNASLGAMAPSSFQCWIKSVFCTRATDRRRGASYYLNNANGESLVDFVGRFEYLARDFAKICETCNITARLPTLNASSHLDYRLYYDSECRELVRESFRDDIENYGYTF